MNDDEAPSASRRQLFKTLALGSLAAAAAGCAKESDRPADSSAAAGEYKPTFFNAAEWEFILAACDRLIPADEFGPSALQAGVPEFIDRHMQTPYAGGDIWYMQGPFIEAAPQFGYQGRLPVRDILRVGMKSIDAHCEKTLAGKTFAQLAHSDQETLLKAAEAGKLELENISAKEFFNQLLGETRMGYFCDPKYGGNKNMAAWKMIGFPGMRADYTNWVEVRDRSYPLPPVDLAGKRG
ncbi:MAG TPA: gluconate 2-dehydrogenase subunit 3 family protein [Steroidobacteraceae bacterium]|jgi:gluconate 2-dehydrogenase gamma chain